MISKKLEGTVKIKVGAMMKAGMSQIKDDLDGTTL